MFLVGLLYKVRITPTDDECCSLDMIKGKAYRWTLLAAYLNFSYSVMSGIITGPHFDNYFHHLSDVQLGSVVAILEIGALSTS